MSNCKDKTGGIVNNSEVKETKDRVDASQCSSNCKLALTENTNNITKNRKDNPNNDISHGSINNNRYHSYDNIIKSTVNVIPQTNTISRFKPHISLRKAEQKDKSNPQCSTNPLNIQQVSELETNKKFTFRDSTLTNTAINCKYSDRQTFKVKDFILESEPPSDNEFINKITLKHINCLDTNILDDLGPNVNGCNETHNDALEVEKPSRESSTFGMSSGLSLKKLVNSDLINFELTIDKKFVKAWDIRKEISENVLSRDLKKEEETFVSSFGFEGICGGDFNKKNNSKKVEKIEFRDIKRNDINNINTENNDIKDHEIYDIEYIDSYNVNKPNTNNKIISISNSNKDSDNIKNSIVSDINLPNTTPFIPNQHKDFMCTIYSDVDENELYSPNSPAKLSNIKINLKDNLSDFKSMNIENINKQNMRFPFPLKGQLFTSNISTSQITEGSIPKLNLDLSNIRPSIRPMDFELKFNRDDIISPMFFLNDIRVNTFVNQASVSSRIDNKVDKVIGDMFFTTKNRNWINSTDGEIPDEVMFTTADKDFLNEDIGEDRFIKVKTKRSKLSKQSKRQTRQMSEDKELHLKRERLSDENEFFSSSKFTVIKKKRNYTEEKNKKENSTLNKHKDDKCLVF